MGNGASRRLDCGGGRVAAGSARGSAARLALLRKSAGGSFQLADPDGTLIDVEEDR